MSVNEHTENTELTEQEPGASLRRSLRIAAACSRRGKVFMSRSVRSVISEVRFGL